MWRPFFVSGASLGFLRERSGDTGEKKTEKDEQQ